MDRRRGELELPGSMPEPPGFLPPAALVEWGRITSLSQYAKVLAQADRATIALYCCLWAEFEASCQPGADAMVTSRLMLMMNVAGKLGMNPSDRVRVMIPGGEKKPSNKFADLR